MARGSRKRPLLSGGAGASNDADDPPTGVDFELKDDVDAFVAKRHAARQEDIDSDSDGVPSADEPEVYERVVLPVDLSDSDEDADAGVVDLDDGDADAAKDGADDQDGRDWGARRRNWYGGDTHEYEIMEDGERDVALREEEEEAVLMQKDALSALQPEDFFDAHADADAPAKKSTTSPSDDDDTSDDEHEIIPSQLDANGEALSAPVASPELPLLLEEAVHVEAQLPAIEARAQNSESAALLYHAYASFLSNVAYYLALRSDPAAKAVDCRTHPVVARIVRLRALVETARKRMDEADSDSDDGGVDELNDGLQAGKRSAVDRNDLGANCNGDKKDKKSKKSKRSMKDKEERKRKRVSTELANGITNGEAFVEDDDEVTGLFRAGASSDDHEDTGKAHKRRKLNKLVGAMERDRRNKDGKRMASADVDLLPDARRMQRLASRAMPNGDVGEEMEDPAIVGDEDGSGDSDGDAGFGQDDDDVVRKMVRKKEKRNSRKARKVAEAAKPHVYTFNDRVHVDSKRKASTQVVKNRGLMRYRPRNKKIPRTKNRLAYDKALQRRKSVTKGYEGIPGLNYGGESRGINMSVRNGSRLSSM